MPYLLRRTRRLLFVSPLLLALGTTARAQQLVAPIAESSSLDTSLPDSPTPQTGNQTGNRKRRGGRVQFFKVQIIENHADEHKEQIMSA